LLQKVNSELGLNPIIIQEDKIIQQIYEESGSEIENQDRKLPMDAFSIVGIAWALASKNKDDKDSVEFATLVQNYLDRTIEKYNSDPLASRFFQILLPIMDGAIAKISLARNMALKSIDYENERKDAVLKKLDQISSLGSNFQSTVVRILGASLGGAIGAFPQITNIDLLNKSPTIIIGIAIGYGLAEAVLQVYRIIEEQRVKTETIEKRKKIWDDEFTSETMVTSLRLYNEATIIANELYKLDSKKFVREIARDFKKIAELFIQRPIIGTRGSDFSHFLQVCSDIEFTMSCFIHDDPDLPLQFTKFRKRQRIQENDNTIQLEPSKSGFGGLTKFLEEKKLIKTKDLRRSIMRIRNRRISIIQNANYSGLSDEIKSAEKVKRELVKELYEEDEVFPGKITSNLQKN
jgi:hypothetical protein